MTDTEPYTPSLDEPKVWSSDEFDPPLTSGQAEQVQSIVNEVIRHERERAQGAAHVSESGLRHLGAVCEPEDGMTFEEVHDGDEGTTIRACRVCGARRVGREDIYGRPITGEVSL